MKVIGLFRELRGDLSVSLPSIHDEVGKLDLDVAARIKSYLLNGIGVFDAMEAVRDPLDTSQFISGGSSLVSDGEYIWRHDLAHFVGRYRVGLPNVFIQHVLEKATPPDATVVMSKADEIWRVYGEAERGG
jgi:hypothetical protein